MRRGRAGRWRESGPGPAAPAVPRGSGAPRPAARLPSVSGGGPRRPRGRSRRPGPPAPGAYRCAIAGRAGSPLRPATASCAPAVSRVPRVDTAPRGLGGQRGSRRTDPAAPAGRVSVLPTPAELSAARPRVPAAGDPLRVTGSAGAARPPPALVLVLLPLSPPPSGRRRGGRREPWIRNRTDPGSGLRAGAGGIS